jgi:ribosome-binding protein aMBF1 (putative translation factor)
MAARRIEPMRPTASARTHAERMKDKLRETVARNLLASREAAGLSQRQLSELSNVSQTYISQVEQGKRNLTLDLLAQLAAHLGTTPVDLLSD